MCCVLVFRCRSCVRFFFVAYDVELCSYPRNFVASKQAWCNCVSRNSCSVYRIDWRSVLHLLSLCFQERNASAFAVCATLCPMKNCLCTGFQSCQSAITSLRPKNILSIRPLWFCKYQYSLSFLWHTSMRVNVELLQQSTVSFTFFGISDSKCPISCIENFPLHCMFTQFCE